MGNKIDSNLLSTKNPSLPAECFTEEMRPCNNSTRVRMLNHLRTMEDHVIVVLAAKRILSGYVDVINKSKEDAFIFDGMCKAVNGASGSISDSIVVLQEYFEELSGEEKN